MRVRILARARVAPDGLTVELLKPGELHELRDGLAQSLIDSGLAELDKSQDAPEETKAQAPKRRTRRAPARRTK